MESHYSWLGVSKDATEADIRKAYHAQAKANHPDKNKFGEHLFKRINAAYEILSDPVKRELYDQSILKKKLNGGSIDEKREILLLSTNGQVYQNDLDGFQEPVTKRLKRTFNEDPGNLSQRAPILIDEASEVIEILDDNDSATSNSQKVSDSDDSDSDDSDSDDSDSDDSDSDDSDSDSDDDGLLLSRSVFGENYKSKPTTYKASREEHLDGISNDADIALQLLLWEIGFGYDVLAHQFEAIRIVAGLVPTFPVPFNHANPRNLFEQKAASMAARDRASEVRRETALKLAAREFVARRNPNNTSMSYTHTLSTNGVMLADEMGLGKTISSIAGAILRNAILCNCKDEKLPTLIVLPQDGVQDQWYETLVKAGVKPSKIEVFAGDSDVKNKKLREKYCAGNTATYSRKFKVQEQEFVLCTRYKIQSDLRDLFEHHRKTLSCNCFSREVNRFKEETLFRGIPWDFIGKLRNQYEAANSIKVKNKFKKKKACEVKSTEKDEDCVTRLCKEESIRATKESKNTSRYTFQTFIVDEAHFCKNVLAYWGLGLAALGIRSKRNIMVTGTPYNNGISDMAALMTYINPAAEEAKLDWWEMATGLERVSPGKTALCGEMVEKWRKAYMIRREKDILSSKLPPRNRSAIDAMAMPSELWIYDKFEGKFLKIIKICTALMHDPGRANQKKNLQIMMGCMSMMRMALIHPILPVGGRELTIQFSPSRCHLLKEEERPKECVFCKKYPTDKEYEEYCGDDDSENMEKALLASEGIEQAITELGDDQFIDVELDEEPFADHDYEDNSKSDVEEKTMGKLVPLGIDVCRASGTLCQHFAHEKCIENNAGKPCPRCYDLSSRLHGRFSIEAQCYCKKTCTHIDKEPGKGGFVASAKIKKAIEWFQGVPKNDKAIIFSFFKGSLDLVEGALVKDFGIDCARYDGDIKNMEIRKKELERFKKSKSCRLLLATVHSVGVGLNIAEANHVCFLDRWFNPCVHDQAESRCHRIGQKKDVHVGYIDAMCTVDDVMKRIGALKGKNARIILADGTSLAEENFRLTFNNLTGEIGSAIRALRELRQAAIQENGETPIPPCTESDLERKMREIKKRGKDEYEWEPKSPSSTSARGPSRSEQNSFSGSRLASQKKILREGMRRWRSNGSEEYD